VALRSRFGRLENAFARLTGQRKEAIHEEALAARRVGEAKGRLSLVDEAQRTLAALQHRAHERSVGVFENLLSAILTDVLPGRSKMQGTWKMRWMVPGAQWPIFCRLVYVLPP
jgi:hypothetical protein